MGHPLDAPSASFRTHGLLKVYFLCLFFCDGRVPYPSTGARLFFTPLYTVLLQSMRCGGGRGEGCVWGGRCRSGSVCRSCSACTPEIRRFLEKALLLGYICRTAVHYLHPFHLQPCPAKNLVERCMPGIFRGIFTRCGSCWPPALTQLSRCGRRAPEWKGLAHFGGGRGRGELLEGVASIGSTFWALFFFFCFRVAVFLLPDLRVPQSRGSLGTHAADGQVPVLSFLWPACAVGVSKRRCDRALPTFISRRGRGVVQQCWRCFEVWPPHQYTSCGLLVRCVAHSLGTSKGRKPPSRFTCTSGFQNSRA